MINLENKGYDLTNMNPTMQDEYVGAMQTAYNEVWETMAQDMSAPSATMHRDEIFGMVSDRIHDLPLNPAIVWWRCMTPAQRGTFLPEIFPCEFYEVGNDDTQFCVACERGDLPSHDGSRMCESGSIASGGTRSHCTCDWCF